ncbi:protein PFF0380w-like [Anoplophora glabripennis]|uniref:protein PFF0380w-like n=1 Tax=Anoplophora glabripennis TaxID=217634 RepID=UPI000874ED50|nr:protein PFF0380w-like [Anoplophora glabripennis]
MDLSFNSRMEAYYQKFYELQERLRKSEEERLKLEMKFNELVQISREEEQAHYKKLRSQYKKFLEEDRKRQERNEKIIRALERIESRVNMLTSKTERVKMLRHQYQTYLQRITQRPLVKQEYFPPKIVEELPSEHKPSYDYDKKSSDIAMLKKAYGKTNDEKIEILDKYLQNLKSQKGQAASEIKPKENKNDFSELKYFDEASKKLNEDFNSNKANSIAEDIMNSIYSRHYNTDLYKDETKKASKFTSPNYTSRYPDKDKYSGFGDSSLNNYQYGSIRDSPPVGLHVSSPNFIGTTSRNHDMNKFNEKPYTSGNIAKGLRPFEEDTRAESKTYENTFKNSVDLSLPQRYKENKTLPKEMYESDTQFRENNLLGPSKTEIDLNENEKQVILNTPTTEPGVKKSEANCIEDNKEYNLHIPEIVKEDGTNLKTNIEYSNENKDELNETLSKAEEFDRHDIRPGREIDYIEALSNNDEPKTIESNNNQSNVDIQNLASKTELNEKEEHEENELNQQYESYEPVGDNDQPNSVQCDDQVIYDESNQQLQAQFENNDQAYDENAQPYDQMDQYDSSDQPIEQLYGENGKALLQYDENGQTIYDQEYDKDDQSKQHSFEGHGEDIPQYDINAHEIHNESGQPSKEYDENKQTAQLYDENSQPVEYDENGQPIQQYDENGQPEGQLIQQFDETGQLVHQYDESNKPIQQYDEIEQPIQQYHGNGEVIQQYDENGQPIQQYDEHSQPIQQYDANSQPIQQYNENSQPIQQYDENGKPIQQYVESHQPVQQFDENGQPIQQYAEGQEPIQQFDENGQPIQQYDENIQPVYYQGDELVQYDENGQIIQQYDENGQPIPPTVYDESYQHYDANGQPIVQYEGQLPKEFDGNGQTVQQYETDQYNADQQGQDIQGGVGEENVTKDNIKTENENVEQPSRKRNVLDLLDTDSESIKQNTSKISNDSDFDFSNG